MQTKTSPQLIMTAVPSTITAIFVTFMMTSSNPPTPPTVAASNPTLTGKEILKNVKVWKMFLSPLTLFLSPCSLFSPNKFLVLRDAVKHVLAEFVR